MQYNLWEPPRLTNYKAKRKVDIKQTAIWRWLSEALCDSSEHKLQFMLNVFASKLQKPWIKISKFLILYSEMHGSGKTSVLKFLEALYGQDKVAYCDTIDQVLDAQNWTFVNKLWVFIDDIKKMTVKQSLALKSMITGDTLRVKKLHSDPGSLPTFMDCVCSSNSKTPKFVEAHDRRDEIVAFNPKFADPKMQYFWDDFYDEIEDPDVMKAWFNYLLEFEITMPVNRRTCRFDTAELQNQKKKCFIVAHEFLADFFSNHGWAYMYEQKNQCSCHFNDLQVQENSLYISFRRLFGYFKQWLKENQVRKSASSKRFKDSLELLGMVKTRKSMYGSRPWCIELNKELIEKALIKHYSLGDHQLDWADFTQPNQTDLLDFFDMNPDDK